MNKFPTLPRMMGKDIEVFAYDRLNTTRKINDWFVLEPEAEFRERLVRILRGDKQ